MPGYVYNGTTWKQMSVPGLTVTTPNGNKAVDYGYVWTGTQWKEWYRKAIAAPVSLEATNIGSATTSIDFSWSAVPEAESYDLYYRVDDVGAYTRKSSHTGTTASVTGLTADTKYAWVVTATRGDLTSGYSNTIKVKTGHSKKAIAGGTGYVSGSVVSHNRWRDSTWGYGGSGEPYWGWYSVESRRYHGFLEVTDWVLWNKVIEKYPAIGPYRNDVACTAAGLFMRRKEGVGDWGSDVTAQVSLGNGIAYASSSEPGEQLNVFDITLSRVVTENGVQKHVGYSMPGNWFQAIYQHHASYNGFLFRPYRNDGVRQRYAAILQDAVWDMHLKWGEITTVTEKKTEAW